MKFKKRPLYFLFPIFLFSLVLSGCAHEGQKAADIFTNDDSMAEEGAMRGENNDTIMEDEPSTDDGGTDDEMMMEEDESAMQESENMDFSGTVLAGSAAPLLDFSQADYEKALASGKPVFLYFYANWCPVCKEEQEVLTTAFNSIKNESIIGFRVNYKDNETDDDEVALARQFGIAYQHTKVAIQDGETVLKAPDSWDIERYENELQKLTR